MLQFTTFLTIHFYSFLKHSDCETVVTAGTHRGSKRKTSIFASFFSRNIVECWKWLWSDVNIISLKALKSHFSSSVTCLEHVKMRAKTGVLREKKKKSGLRYTGKNTKIKNDKAERTCVRTNECHVNKSHCVLVVICINHGVTL